MLSLRFAKSAAKVLGRMPAGVAQRMLQELKAIAENPNGYRGDFKPLAGTTLWRLRVGDWRAICDRQEDALVLLVVKIGSRGDIYK